MDRRDFLKVGGLLSAALFVQFNPIGSLMLHPVGVEAQGNLYRGTTDGKILVSYNGGRLWKTV